MKKLAATLGLFVATLSPAVSADTAKQFTVTGKLIPTGLFISTVFDDRKAHVPEDMDWSKARVLVGREIVNPKGETEFVELATGQFVDGSIELVGKTDQPIEAQISVYAGETKLSTVQALVSPGSTVSFVLMENHAHLELLGASRDSRDSNSKFTISGDFSYMADELEGAIVRVRAGEYNVTGERVSLIFGRLVPDEGRFLIEADVDEPRIVNILIVSPSGATGQTRAIVEPGAKITISSQTESLGGLVATSGDGKHAQLIESWEQSEEYLETIQAYRIARQEYMEKREADGTGSIAAASQASEEETPKYRELSQELRRLRYDFLQDVASNAENPIDVLLALELGAYRGQEEGLSIYDQLAKSLEKDLVSRRVVHARNEAAMYIARAVKDKSLEIGKKAPDFTLQNFEGEDMSLSDILDEKEYVLVDFWASWCGPCIATFPALKDLYASYGERGFEIVSVSIDDNREMWSYSTEEYGLPWINLGELKGFEGEMVTSYGVNFVPKGYLLDAAGQIVQKDLTTDQLKTFLGSVYGDPNE